MTGEEEEHPYLARLHAWRAPRTVLRYDGHRPDRVIVDIRDCRWPCPRWDDHGDECVAVIDLAEPHDTRFRISNVHIVPGDLTPAADNNLGSER